MGIFLILVLTALHAEAGETVILTSDTLVRDGASVTLVTANTSAQILKNKGFWVQIKTAQGVVGWVKLSKLTFPQDMTSKYPSPLNGVSSGRVVPNSK